MVMQVLQFPVASSSSSPSTSTTTTATACNGPGIFSHLHHLRFRNSLPLNSSNTTPPNFILTLSLHHHHHHHHHRRRSVHPARAAADDFESTSPATTTTFEEEDQVDPTPDDLEYISQIKTVLELLKKNRDMLFGEVKLTIMIEDPREVERKRLLGIDDSDGPTREDLVTALEEVNDGKIPKNRVALSMLAEEMNSWPNLEVEASKKSGKSRSLYAKATDTGIDPDVAAKRLNIDWDSAAEIEEAETTDDTEVPPAVGYGALYLVTAFPVIIGISVVLILFYNSLQ